MNPKLVVFWLVMAAIAAWLIFFCSCSMTVAPKPVNAGVIAFDKSGQENAGVISADQNGVVVSQHWISEYRRMEKDSNYQVDIDADVKIRQLPNGTYVVPFLVNNRFATMKAAERGP